MTNILTEHDKYHPRKFTRLVIRQWVGWGLVLAAVGIAAHAMTYFSAYFAWADLNTGAERLMLAMGVLIVGLLVAPARQSASQLSLTPPPASPRAVEQGEQRRIIAGQLMLVGGGLLMLLTVSEISGNLLKQPSPLRLSTHLQFGLWFAGILGIGLGLSGATFGGIRQRVRVGFQRHRTEILLVTGLTVIAFALRMWRIDSALRVFIDELNFTDGIRRLWDEPTLPLLQPFSSITAFPYVYLYWQNWAVELLGVNLGAIRAVSAVFGALTVPAVYWLTRQVADRLPHPALTALAAAALLATFPPHLQFSRIGLNNVVDPLFGVLALACLTRGLRTGDRAAFVWAGIALGMTHYFYEGGRIFYTPFVLGWLIFHLLFQYKRLRLPISAVGQHTGAPLPSSIRESNVNRAWLGRLAVFVIAFLLVVLPVYYTLYGMGRPIFQRLETTQPRSEDWEHEPWYDQLEAVQRLLRFGGMMVIGEPEMLYYYSGDTPLLLIFMTPLVALGMAYALRYWQQADGIPLVIWAALPTAAAVLFLDTLTTARMVVSFPAMMILAALAVTDIPRQLIPHPLTPSPSNREGENTNRKGAKEPQSIEVGTSNTNRQDAEITAQPHPNPSSFDREEQRGGDYSALSPQPLTLALATHHAPLVTRTRIAALVSAVLVGVVCGIQVFYYYDLHIERFMQKHYAYFPGQEAVFMAADLPPGTQIHIIDYSTIREPDARGMVDFLMGTDGVEVFTHLPEELTNEYLVGLSRDHHQAFIVASGEIPTDIIEHQLETVFGQSPARIMGENRYTPWKRYVLYFVERRATP